MTVRAPEFDFARCVGSNVLGNLNALDGESKRWDKSLVARFYPAFGRMVILNGWNANTQVIRATTTLGSNGISHVQPLLMPAPKLYLVPMVSGIGSGHVFGTNYKWRIRWKNSITGDVSGLSPVSPWTMNMGAETTPGSDRYLGQTAYFRIASVIGTDTPAYCDTIELFRNASGNLDIWYLVQEKLIDTTVSYTDFRDDNTDAEILTNGITAGMQPNPTFLEGMLPQVAKCHAHATSRLFFYGILKANPYRTGTVSIIVGSTTVTRTDTTTIWDNSRVGQSFRLRTYGGAANQDPTIYRIISVGADGSTLTVAPEMQVSPVFPTEGTTYTTVSYEIVDDRDARLVYVTQPGNPTSFDIVEDVFAIGHDADDRLLHIFSLRGVTYGQTERGLFRLINDVSTDPDATLLIAKVSDEGTTGFDSGCMTPYGWAYVHPLLGVRLFDGNAPPQGYETLGTITPSYPLGATRAQDVFGPFDQFHGRSDDAYQSLTGMDTTGFDPHLLSECRMIFDPVESLVHVFYVPNGKWSLREELCFDGTVNCWRGPWRRCATVGGLLKNSDGTDQFLFGNDTGGLWIDNRQEHDLYPGSTPTAAANTSGVGYVLVNSGASFDATTYKEEGSPVVLYSAVGGTPSRSLQVTPIVDVVNGTSLVLEEYVMESGFTWTYLVAAIRWFLQGGWIDSDEPAQPKILKGLRTRFQRAASGASTATFGVLLDGNEDLSTITGEQGVVFPLDPNSSTEPAYRFVRLNTGSKLFAIVAYGTAVTRDPEITKVVMDMDIEGGSAGA